METNNDGDDDNGPLVQAPDEQKLEPKKNKPAPSGSYRRARRKAASGKKTVADSIDRQITP